MSILSFSRALARAGVTPRIAVTLESRSSVSATRSMDVAEALFERELLKREDHRIERLTALLHVELKIRIALFDARLQCIAHIIR